MRSRDDLQTTVVFKKHGRGRLTVAFGLNGHVLHIYGAARNGQDVALRTTAHVLAYLES